MKKLTTAILFILVTININAQDKIYFNDGTTLETKISNMTEVEMQYKRFDNLSGPTFTIGLENVNMVVFENGTHQMINTKPKKVVSTRGNFRGQRRNRLNADLLAIGNSGPTSISYERLNPEGTRGVEIPLNVYFDADGGTGFATGANIKYYVGSGGGRGFYIGPSFALGIFSFENEYYDPYYYYDFWYTSFGVWTGVKLGQQFQLSDLFGINLAGNLGAYSDFDVIQLGFSLNLGINFSFL